MLLLKGALSGLMAGLLGTGGANRGAAMTASDLKKKNLSQLQRSLVWVSS